MFGVFNISQTETQIMELLWERKGMTSKDILEYFNTNLDKEWKKQTLNTFLSRLIDKGLVTLVPSTKKRVYGPAVTREQYEQRKAKSIIDVLYNGSLKNFVVALNGGTQITEEEAKMLRKVIDK